MTSYLKLYTFLVVLLCICAPALAFGSGNIPQDSTLDEYNWRHGDIEDLLANLPMSFVTHKVFSALDVKRVYFGNWLRDYSQLLDITCLTKVPANYLRAVISVLAFMAFGYATDEFDVTKERLGLYRPEEHIDNPKGYGVDDNGKLLPIDKLNQRLKGLTLRSIPKPEECAIDAETGMKNYIANEKIGIRTSLAYIREKLKVCIKSGRAGRRGDESARKEALIALDFPAHSNYVELALQKIGVTEAFAYVGDSCKVNVGPSKTEEAAPIVTGTFGTLDMYQSILGEVDDKTAAQNLNELDVRLVNSIDLTQSAFEGLQLAIRGVAFILPQANEWYKEMNKLMESTKTVRQDSDRFEDLPDHNDDDGVWETIEPIFRFRDEIARTITSNLRIPLVSDALAEISAALDKFVYSLLAAFIKPVIQNMRDSLLVAKQEVQRMENAQPTIFDIGSTVSDPTHTLLAKDHFTNALNPVAGLVATVITNLTTQSVVRAWDDDNDTYDDQTVSNILQALHHPFNATKSNLIQVHMLATVQKWWTDLRDDEREDLKKRLSKEGVRNDQNNVGGKHYGRKAKGHATFEGSAPEVVKEKEKDLLDAAGDLANDISRTVVNQGVKAIDAIGNGVNQVKNAVNETVNESTSVLGDAFSSVDKAITDLVTVPTAFNPNTFDEALKQAGGSVVDILKDVPISVISAAPAMGQLLKDGAIQQLEETGRAAGNVVTDINRGLAEAVDVVSSWLPW